MKFIKNLVQKSLVMMFVVTFASLHGMNNPKNQIIYRAAELSDVDVLFNMQDTFTPEDAQRLLVFPKQVRTAVLESSIKKNRFFVAIDSESSSIIGLVKLFLIDNQDELTEILRDELRLGKGEPVLDCSYNITTKSIFDFKSALVAQDSLLSEHEDISLCSGTAPCLYIYYGGAYTVPNRRGECINTNLIKFALEQIQSDCLHMVREGDLEYGALAYGQVEANTNQKGMIRLFADFIHTLMCETHTDKSDCQIYVQHVAYRAYKPVLIFDEIKNDLVMLPDVEDNKGQGNLAVIKI